MTTEAEEILKTVVQCIDAEPELPGDIPKEMLALIHTMLARDGVKGMEEILRLFVRTTKDCIRKRVIKALAPEGSVAQTLGILQGQCFKWVGDGTGEIVWSIEAAKQIIGDRPPRVEMRPEHWMMALDANTLAHEINADYAKKCDCNKPLIAVQSPSHSDVPGAMILIDGWHRILGAILTSRTESMMVHLLSHDEEMQCRITEMP